MHDACLYVRHLSHLLHGAALMFFLMRCATLWPRRNENAVVRLMLLIMALIAGLLVKDLCDLAGEGWLSGFVVNLSTCLDMCLVPVITAFSFRILAPRWTSAARVAAICTPSVLLTAAYAVFRTDAVFNIMYIYTAVLVAVWAFFTLTGVARYDRWVKDNYSDADRLSVAWLGGATIALTCWYVVWAVFVLQHGWWSVAVYMVFLIVIWEIIYRYTMRHAILADAPDMLRPLPGRGQNQRYSPVMRSLPATLETYMGRERPWMDPSLSLSELSQAVGTNRTYLSDYINNSLGTTFCDYLNSFRIAQACSLMAADSRLSLEEVAERSGFNSMSTFRRAFRKELGCNPAQYRKATG